MSTMETCPMCDEDMPAGGTCQECGYSEDWESKNPEAVELAVASSDGMQRLARIQQGDGSPEDEAWLRDMQQRASSVLPNSEGEESNAQ
jgi:hypothetical protein